jgi:Bax protein
LQRDPFLTFAYTLLVISSIFLIIIFASVPDFQDGAVKTPEIASDPAQKAAKPTMSVSKKKKRFRSLLVPAIDKVYAELQQRYIDVAKAVASGADEDKFAALREKYRAEDNEDLLAALKPHPKSIALAQAAMESSWATSRFFRKANNVFGIWSFNEDEPRLAAGEKRGEETIWVKKYPSIEASVKDYYRTLARGAAYSEFRRLKLKTDDPHQLVKKLDRYSEKGAAYGEELSSIIKFNNFEKFDQSGQNLPELPVPAGQDVESQQQVGDPVRQNTVDQAAAPVKQQAVSHPGHDAGQDQVMFETEQDGSDQKGREGEGTDAHRGKVRVNDVTQQE